MKLGVPLRFFRKYFTHIRLFKAIGLLTLARHAGAALATDISILVFVLAAHVLLAL